MNYASFKIRFLASLIDGAFYILSLAILLYYILSQSTLPSMMYAVFVSFIILINPIFIFYSIILTHYFGGSLGKLITGLRIVSEENKRLSFKRIFFRQTIGYSFSWIFFGLGYLSLIKDSKKQAWHDKTVGSVVTAKHNLFAVGLMAYIMLFIASITLAVSAINNFQKGQVSAEVKKMFKQISSGSKYKNHMLNKLKLEDNSLNTSSYTMTTYQDASVYFKYPVTWKMNKLTVKPQFINQSFTDPSKLYDFNVTSNPNFNEITNLPYASLYEYAKVNSTIPLISIAGQSALQVLPRAGSENKNRVYFFSPNKESIFAIELTTYSDKTEDIEKGRQLFYDITSSFKFSTK